MHTLILEKFHQNRRARFGLLYLTLLVILIHLLMTASILLKSAYPLHAIFSENIRLYGQFQTEQHQIISYPLFHFVMNFLMTVTGQNPPVASYGIAMSAGIATTLIFRVITAHIIYITLCVISPKDVTVRSMAFYIFLTVGLLIIAPILIFSLDGQGLLSGYFSANAYHSPSNLIVIPFGLLVFFASMNVFSDKNTSPLFTFLIAILAATTLLAKPSFTIGFVPALALAIIVQKLRKQTIQWQPAMAIIIPSILVLAGQFFLTYISSTGDGGVAIRPFYLPLRYDGSYIMIFTKAFVSLIFPLLVIILYRDSLKENMIKLSWLFLIIGISYDWVLVEEGIRLGHRNFQWTAGIANFILFTVHILYLVKHHFNEMLYQRWSWKLSLVLGVFALHAISGFHFYILMWSLPNQ